MGPPKLFGTSHFFFGSFIFPMPTHPLHKAAQNGDVAAVRAALSTGIDVDIIDGVCVFFVIRCTFS